MPYRQYRSTMLYMGRICSTVVTSERGRVGKSLPFFDLSECVQMSVCPQNHTEDLLLHLCQMSIHMCDALGIIRECIYSVLKSYYPASGWWELSPTAPIVYAALPYSLMVHHNSRCESVSWYIGQRKWQQHLMASCISSSNVGRSKLLSGSASYDLCKSPISILQKKAISELYWVIPFSSCAFNVCGSYVHFNFFPYKLPLNKTVNALCLYCTDL